MNRKLAALLSLLAVIVAVVFGTAPDGGTPEEDLAILLVAFGDESEVIRSGKPVEHLEVGMQLRVGDVLRAKGAAFMDLWIGRIATVRVQPGGELTVKEATDNLAGHAGTSGVEVTVLQGAATSRVRLLDRLSHYKMNGVPVLTAARSTGYEVSLVEQGKSARVTVGEGTVRAASSTNPTQTLDVNGGESVLLEPSLPEAATPDLAGARRVLADIASMGLPPENVAPGSVSRLPEPALALQRRALTNEQALWWSLSNLTGVIRPNAVPQVTEDGWANADLLRATFSSMADKRTSLYFPLLRLGRVQRLLDGEVEDSARRLASFPLPVYSAVVFGTPLADQGHPTLFHGFFDQAIVDSTTDLPRRGTPLWFRDGRGGSTLLAKDGALVDIDLNGRKVLLVSLSEGLVVVDLFSGSRTVIDRAWYPLFWYDQYTTSISSSGKYVYYKTMDQKHRVVDAATGELVGEPADPNLGFVNEYQFLDDHDFLWNNNLVYDPATRKTVRLDGHTRGMQPQGQGRSKWLRTADAIVQYHYPGGNAPTVFSRWTVEAIRATPDQGSVSPQSVTIASPSGEWLTFSLYQLVNASTGTWVLHWGSMDHWKLDEVYSLQSQDSYSQAMLLRASGAESGKRVRMYEPRSKTMWPWVTVNETGQWGEILPGGAAFAWGSNNVGEGFVSIYSKAGRPLYSEAGEFGFRTTMTDRLVESSGSVHFYGDPTIGVRAASAMERLSGLWFLPLVLGLVAYFPELRGWASGLRSRVPDRSRPAVLDALLLLTGALAQAVAAQSSGESVQRLECPGCRATLPTNFTQCSYCLVSLEGARTVSVTVSRPAMTTSGSYSVAHALIPLLTVVALGGAAWLVLATFGRWDSVGANFKIIPLFTSLVVGGALLVAVGNVVPCLRVSLGRKLGVLNLLGVGLILVAWAMRFSPELTAREVSIVPLLVVALAAVANYLLVRVADESGRYR